MRLTNSWARFYALALFHFAFIAKPFATLDPLGLYILAFGIAGVLSYLYTLIPHGWGPGGRDHHVTAVNRTGDALAVTLEPCHRAIKHRPGQFAFVQFALPGLEEVHPFTISKEPDASGQLRFTVKALGDYTRVLEHNLAVGTPARVSGPFGRFRRKRAASREVWIAGGIGVTPFVALARALEPDHPPVDLFYCVRGRQSAAHLEELLAICDGDEHFTVHLVDSLLGERLTADRVAETVDAPLTGIRVYFCGPAPMRDALASGLHALGLRRSAFRHEIFEIRSGIGLRRLAAWLLSLARPPRVETPIRSEAG